MTITRHLASLTAVCWEDVRTQVAMVLPRLANIIDKINPGKQFILYKAKYPYGSLIFHDKQLYMPTVDGGLDVISSSRVLPGVQNNLRRRLMPAVLILKNSAEMFAEMSDRLISGFAMRPGGFLWLWEQLDPQHSEFISWPWSLSSGARTMYMLPKISEVKQHKKLQRDYNISANVPMSPRDHWALFAELANSAEFDEEWCCEALFFTDSWFEMALQDTAWRELRALFFDIAWKDSLYWRYKNAFELIWEKFTIDMISQNVKPNSYLVCIVKQLVLTGMGILPALTVADSDIAAPCKKIQQIYTSSYDIKYYQPLMMHSHGFSFADTHPTYYSLQLLNLLETPVASRNIYSVLSAIPDIKKLLDAFNDKAEREWVAQGSLLDNFIKNVACDFFHHRKEDWSKIAGVDTLPQNDSRMLLKGHHVAKKKFPENSIVLNGCVRFMNKPK